MSESSGDAVRENETQARIERQTIKYQFLLNEFDKNAQQKISNFFFGKFTDFIYNTFGKYIDDNNPENNDSFMKDHVIKKTQEFKKLLIDAVMNNKNDDSISELNDILTSISIYKGDDLKENKNVLNDIITEAQKFKEYKNFRDFIETIINDTVEPRVPEQESTPILENASPGLTSPEKDSPKETSPGQPSPGQPSPRQKAKVEQLRRTVAKEAKASNIGGTKTKKRNVRKTRRSKKTKRSKSRRHSRK